MSDAATEALLPFTQPWADAFCAAIEDDAAVAAAGKGWSWPLAFVLDPAPQLGFAERTAVVFHLNAGHCRSAKVMHASEVTAPFALTGSYTVWKEIVTGALDPVNAVMRRDLALRGAITTLMMYTRFARALVACARRVPMRFPDEA